MRSIVLFITPHYFENKKVVYISKKIGNSSSLDRSNPDRIYEDVSKQTIEQSNADVKSVEYDLPKPEQVDRFLLDGVDTKHHFHNISNEQFIAALKDVNNPVFVTQNAKGQIAVFTEITDSSGKSILVGFELKESETNYLITMYGKNLTEHFFENNNLVWVRDEIENDLSRSESSSRRTYEVVSDYTLRHQTKNVKSAEYGLSKPEEVRSSVIITECLRKTPLKEDEESGE